MAGWQWYYGFMSRHRKLSLRTPEQTSLNRVRAFCKENVDHFFNNLGEVYSRFEPKNIWNMDETGFSNVPSKIGKVISLKGAKRVGKIAAQERGTMITMAHAVNAAGGTIPPFFLFPYKYTKSFLMENAPIGSKGYSNGSGWMQQSDFVQYLDHFVKHTNASIDRPTLLLLDNHASHLSVEAIDKAISHGITLLSFPPHCSHKLQPLDVSVYGPVKLYYKKHCDTWQKNNVNKGLELRHIPGLIKTALEQITPKTIMSGFISTGICPFNPDVFSEVDFVKAEVDGINNSAVEIENELAEDEQRRIVILNEVPDVAANEIISMTPEPSTSSSLSQTPEPSPLMSRSSSMATLSRASSLSNTLNEVGPLKASTPKPPSNRGRKAMKSTVLTSPENIAAIKEKQAKKAMVLQEKEAAAMKRQENAEKRQEEAKKKREAAEKKRQEAAAKKLEKAKQKQEAAEKKRREAAAKKLEKATTKHRIPTSKKPPAKRSKTNVSSSSSDENDQCIVCAEELPAKLSKKNSIACKTCKEIAHAKCAVMSRDFFTCSGCKSSSDEDFDEEE